MKHITLLLILASAGCATSSSNWPFNVRQAAYSVDEKSLSPNKAQLHEDNLRGAIDRSLERQEKMDRVDDLYMPLK